MDFKRNGVNAIPLHIFLDGLQLCRLSITRLIFLQVCALHMKLSNVLVIGWSILH